MGVESTGTRSWAREPLLHFLLLGAGLFLLFRLVASDGGAPKEIVISEPRVEALAQGFARTWLRPPTAQELNGLVEDYIKEEIYYREAVIMGLDRDDVVIRRRLRQKLEFISDDTAAALEPTDEQLQDYLRRHAEKFLQPGRLSFQQLHFSVERRGEAARRDAQKVLGHLQAGHGPVEPSQAGDATLLPAGLDNASPQDIASVYGEDFMEQIEKAPVGPWSGPVQSAYGWHLVRVTARTPDVAPTLEQVGPIVLREWQFEQNQKLSGEFYQSLRSQYDVRVEGELGALLEKYQAARTEAAR